jgi:hypothetical protein
MTVTLFYSWEIKRSTIPLALWHMAVDRLALTRNPKISFFKSLGTGRGETFTPSDADATRWALLVVIEESAVEEFHNSALINSWRSFALHEYRATLAPIASHGKWSKHEPFLASAPAEWDGKIAAITRARIKPRMNRRFWRSVPAVNESLHASPGLIAALGIGEAPIGLQGTFSIWASAGALRDFAYRGQAHQRVIAKTEELGWYSEELFARFALIEERGRISTCRSAATNPADGI